MPKKEKVKYKTQNTKNKESKISRSKDSII